MSLRAPEANASGSADLRARRPARPPRRRKLVQERRELGDAGLDAVRRDRRESEPQGVQRRPLAGEENVSGLDQHATIPGALGELAGVEPGRPLDPKARAALRSRAGELGQVALERALQDLGAIA